MSQKTPDRADPSKVQVETLESSEPVDRKNVSPADEEELFGADSGGRLFGEGSYTEGGSNEEGNWEERDAHPHGRYGRFSDAGGFGAAQLLGEEQPPEAADANAEATVDQRNQRAKHR